MAEAEHSRGSRCGRGAPWALGPWNMAFGALQDMRLGGRWTSGAARVSRPYFSCLQEGASKPTCEHGCGVVWPVGWRLTSMGG